MSQLIFPQFASEWTGGGKRAGGSMGTFGSSDDFETGRRPRVASRQRRSGKDVRCDSDGGGDFRKVKGAFGESLWAVLGLSISISLGRTSCSFHFLSADSYSNSLEFCRGGGASCG